MKRTTAVIRYLFLALFLFLLANGKVTLWLGLYAASLIAAMFFGRVYCGYACPMNTMMIPAEWISRKLKWQAKSIPQWLLNKYFVWAALFISVAAMLLSKRLLHVDIPVLPVWLAVSVLITLRYKPAVFHNLICPFGALQRTFGRFARITTRVDASVCNGCRRCEKSCPSEAIAVTGENRKAVINISLCHQCTNCLQVCPRNAIHYTK